MIDIISIKHSTVTCQLGTHYEHRAKMHNQLALRS